MVNNQILKCINGIAQNTSLQIDPLNPFHFKSINTYPTLQQ